jgi:hypothetical protein
MDPLVSEAAMIPWLLIEGGAGHTPVSRFRRTAINRNEALYRRSVGAVTSQSTSPFSAVCRNPQTNGDRSMFYHGSGADIYSNLFLKQLRTLDPCQQESLVIKSHRRL